jgi:excisionase family DNA binding protein
MTGNPEAPGPRRSSPRHHTVADLAERWQVSERTVRRLIENGKLRAMRIGNQLRVADDALRRFEDHHEIR